MRKKGYVFLSNSTKPTKEEQNSREEVKLTNVSRPCLQTALDMGYEVFFGTNRNEPENLLCELPVHKYDSHSYRSITAFKDNWIAFKNLRKVIKENNIEVIHCNTPVGGLVGRVCGKLYHVDTVIYTAHGFHFFRGAPLINRTIYKWAEQIMAHWTDVIITMNKEDFVSAKKFHLKKGGKVYKVHGVGITLEEYENVDVSREEKLKSLGIPEDAVVCVSAGDLVERKNYKIAIEALALARDRRIHYLICGNGDELDSLKHLAKEKGLSDNIHFLGFRTDIKELYKISDFFILSSYQEGLPRSTMEAMAMGLPLVCSKIRGNTDLVKEEVNGFLCDPDNAEDFAAAIIKIVNDSELRNSMRNNNLKKIKEYDVKIVKKEIEKIYSWTLRK